VPADSDDALARSRLAAAVPANVREVCAKLQAAGHQSVTVGGAVRDAILGRTPGDWDVATAATPDQVTALFPRTIPTGIQHGTVTIVTGRGLASHVEVTTFRGEGAYTDARRPDHVRFGVPLVEDLARRDFRVNAMAYDPAADQLIDPYDGRRDLDERMLRAVGPTGDVYEDAVARFTEDGLRVMRAVRFAAQLEFALDADTERGIGPALPSLAKVSKERISDELRKLLGADRPSLGLRIAERAGIVRLIAAPLASAIEARADIEHWLARVDAAPTNVRLGAMFAELARRQPLPRLDRVLAKDAEQLLKSLKFANDEAALAATLVGIAPASMIEEAWTLPDVRRLLSDVTRPRVDAAIAFFRADGATALADQAAAVAGDPIAVGELAIAGKDLMEALAMAPGPSIGRILQLLLDRAIQDPSINTREQLIELARGIELGFAR
jgi:tRNA nucleotidyltransferase (CCA-adding enzyme)